MSAEAPMKDFRDVMRKALEGLNLEKSQQHSQMDHHTVGMDYLNLQRSDKFTLKLYLIEKDVNHNSGFLVHPHTHRYEFNTVVLAGSIGNLIFEDVGKKPKKSPQELYEDEIAGGGDFGADHYQYTYEDGLIDVPIKTWLNIHTGASAGYTVGQSYFIKTDQIHTLVTRGEPTLLCLSQFEDKAKANSLYLPHGTVLQERTGRTPSMEEMVAMRNRCLELINASNQ